MRGPVAVVVGDAEEQIGVAGMLEAALVDGLLQQYRRLLPGFALHVHSESLPDRDREKVRNFLIKYQNRVLYATDLTLSPLSDEAKAQNPPIDPGADFAASAEGVWRSDWTYLATPENQYVDTLKADTPGLALPRSVIRKIYYENALRVFPAFAHAS